MGRVSQIEYTILGAADTKHLNMQPYAILCYAANVLTYSILYVGHY
jgi:hypothetical protein